MFLRNKPNEKSKAEQFIFMAILLPKCTNKMSEVEKKDTGIKN